MKDTINRLMVVYRNMVDRCHNPKNIGYHRYGGRGIAVCSEWMDNPGKFLAWSMDNGSAPGLQLDRIDNNGPYSPGNCRWATPAENARNRADNVNVTIFGKTQCALDWLSDERCVVKQTVFYRRLRDGWDPEKALTTPAQDFAIRELVAFGEEKGWDDWLADPRCAVNKTTLLARVNRGWEHEEAISTPTGATRKGRVAHNAIMVKAWGEEKAISEWIKDERCACKNHMTILSRINKGWSSERALSKPTAANGGVLYEGKTVSEWSKHPDCKMGYNTLANRLKSGMTVAEAFAKPVIMGNQKRKPKV